MAFKIHKLMDKTAGLFLPTERLFQTADKSKLVSQDDPAAAFLFCIPGRPIPMAIAVRYGLVVFEKEQPAPVPEVEATVTALTTEVDASGTVESNQKPKTEIDESEKKEMKEPHATKELRPQATKSKTKPKPKTRR